MPFCGRWSSTQYNLYVYFILLKLFAYYAFYRPRTRRNSARCISSTEFWTEIERVGFWSACDLALVCNSTGQDTPLPRWMWRDGRRFWQKCSLTGWGLSCVLKWSPRTGDEILVQGSEISVRQQSTMKPNYSLGKQLLWVLAGLPVRNLLERELEVELMRWFADARWFVEGWKRTFFLWLKEAKKKYNLFFQGLHKLPRV